MMSNTMALLFAHHSSFPSIRVHWYDCATVNLKFIRRKRMSQDYILALDQGTTSSRAILFDQTGKPVATSQQEFEQLYPQPGWVEHRPADIWYSQLNAAQRVLSESNVKADQVAAIGITNQRETTIIWNRETGEPIHNAIVWQCRRTAEMCDRLRRDG